MQQASETANILTSKLDTFKLQLKARTEELQQEVKRLEGVVADEKLANDQCEAKAADKIREAKDKANNVVHGLEERLLETEAKANEAQQQASNTINTLRCELDECKLQLKARTEELQQEVKRLEGVATSERSAREQFETEAAKQVRGKIQIMLKILVSFHSCNQQLGLCLAKVRATVLLRFLTSTHRNSSCILSILVLICTPHCHDIQRLSQMLPLLGNSV